ncbi:MAG: IS630 family transposase [Bacteroidota bacterium]
MPRKGNPIVLTDEQRTELLSLTRSQKIQHRYHVRAQIVLMLADGKSYDEVQQKLSLSRSIVAKWKKRFVEVGLDGLKDKPGRGKAPIYSPADEARVLELATSKPPKGYSTWSQGRIAKELGMSQSTVQRILSRQDLKPHKVEYWCGKSTDPEFEAKMLEVVGLYLDPPENALVLSVDEKTQIQALDRTQPELPLRSGKPRRQTATYKRNGTVSLIAALAVHDGQITAKTIDKNNADNFLAFLKHIYRKYPRKQLHIIVDNLAVHKHQKVKEWVASKRRVNMHFTPTYSSWLNQIEIWFNILTKDVLKGAVWTSKKQLVEQIMEYIKYYNLERAKPFRWTYDGTKKNSSLNTGSIH